MDAAAVPFAREGFGKPGRGLKAEGFKSWEVLAHAGLPGAGESYEAGDRLEAVPGFVLGRGCARRDHERDVRKRCFARKEVMEEASSGCWSQMVEGGRISTLCGSVAAENLKERVASVSLGP